jgi:hypothetical protein
MLDHSPEDAEIMAALTGSDLNLDQRARKALKTKSQFRSQHLLEMMMEAMPVEALTRCSEAGLRESLLASFEDFDPQDETERMLHTLRLALLDNSLACMSRANHPSADPSDRQQELHYADKITNGFLRCTEAIDKHRSQGKQTITVKRVLVHSDCQAIVGPVDARMQIAATSYAHKEQNIALLDDESAHSEDGEKFAQALGAEAPKVRVRQRRRDTKSA